MRRRDADRGYPWGRYVALALLVIALMIGAIFAVAWFQDYQAKKRFEAADSPALKAAAVAFAKRGDSVSCEDESVARMNACHANSKGTGKDRSFQGLDERRETLNTCSMEVMHFHRHCLEAAPKSPGFCIRHKGHGMSNQKLLEVRCAGVGFFPDFNCMIIVAASIEHCDPPE